MTHALEVRDLNKYFGGLHATRNVSMALPRGEMHAVIGPNGAGKTTLIAQLFGEVSPTSGTVLVNGRDVTHRPVHERAGLGMARSFQITTLVRDVTVGENVCLALLARRERAFRFWRRIDRNADLQDEAARALARIGMGREHMPRRVADMSHGEQRLLELAVALVGDPTLILLDEPMAGLGSEESRAMTRFLSQLKGRTTVLLVEHDMEAVFELADRLTVLVRGEVVAVGTPAEIRADGRVREAYLGEDA
ncbi:branched-chain amino acid ABC transporter substrate-binding protein [Aureimonas ureilytica]|uniref:Branched-chain amino acid ABC transporter substrate-binding protein n=1 Tax=Aureimonas ureilytica TaxID=401562 RepID=A0A175RNE3_9HYPH|nr:MULTISPECIES: ABC transporter ATP-binding protein [Aureimonas]KTQ96988.1 branched-chain amino acid ABC transporter substrate-binding protein [Aureimonas ureilytica]KTR05260.1 branched-chain amino acid ABC transporter substrate-binding protein [Aureimonas ureilytica]